MSDQVLVTRSYLEDTGDAIREKLETDLAYTPAEFGAAIRSIEGGAGEDAVKYTEQTPTAEQQAQARTNIDAAKNAAFSGGQTVTVQRNGARIVVNDTIDARLPAFTLNGKSTQTGTPSPEDPANITTAGSSGSIDVICADDGAGAGAVTTTIDTPNGLPGIRVPSGGNYIDANDQHWTCDTIDKVSGTYTQRVGKVVWTGDSSEQWTYHAWSLPGFDISVPDSAIQTNINAAPNVLCDRLLPIPNSAAYSQYDALVSMTNNAPIYQVAIDGYSSETAFRGFLAENHITMLYPLATPITTPLTAAQIAALDALRSHEGQTAIYTTDAVQPEVAAGLLTGVSGGAGIVPAPDSGSQYLGSDGEWHTPDDTPTANSDSLITSGAVQAAIAALTARIEALEGGA